MPTLDEIAQAISPDAFAEWQSMAMDKGIAEGTGGYAVIDEHYAERQEKARAAARRVLDCFRQGANAL